MATSGVIDGTLWLVYVDGTAILGTVSSDFGATSQFRDTTTKDSTGGWGEKKPSRKDIDPSAISGLVALDAAYGVEDILTLLSAGTQVTIKHSTGVVGDKRFQYSGYVGSIKVGAPMYDNTTFDLTIEGTGQPTFVANT